MIRIRTGSRLHFGLFSLPSEHAGPWLNQEGEPTIARRQFGGVGLMIDKPGIELTVTDAKEWSADGPLAERALRSAQTCCSAVGVQSSYAIQVYRAAPEHAGLGTGTQLGLAVARGLAELSQQPARDAIALARMVGRGKRSALGVHGFELGGFLVEGGKRVDGAISPLLVRCEFPAAWRIVLVTPRGVAGMHGPRETDAFAAMVKQPPNDRATESLCRLVLLGMLPALAESDADTFGEALHDFNRRSGTLFKAAQGGIYAHPRIEQIVKAVRNFGIKGVGQSSWGPTVFAVAPAEQIGPLMDRLSAEEIAAPDEMIAASPWNHGAEMTTSQQREQGPA